MQSLQQSYTYLPFSILRLPIAKQTPVSGGLVVRPSVCSLTRRPLLPWKIALPSAGASLGWDAEIFLIYADVLLGVLV